MNKRLSIIVTVVLSFFVMIFFTACGTGLSSSSGGDSGAEDKTEIENTENDVSLNSPLQIYEAFETAESLPFTITDKARSFLLEHPDLFPCKGKIDDDLIDYSLNYRQILKNEKKHGDKLLMVNYGQVVEIFEEEIYDGYYFTQVNVSDGEQQYWVYYIGELEDIYEDSYISVIGLPLGTSSFENTNGGKTNVVVIAGAKIEDISSDAEITGGEIADSEEYDYSALDYAGYYEGFSGYSMSFNAYSSVDDDEIGYVEMYYEGENQGQYPVYRCYDWGDWDGWDYDELYVIYYDGWTEYLGFYNSSDGSVYVDYNGPTSNYDQLYMVEHYAS